MSGREGFGEAGTASTGRRARADLVFAAGGDRTFLLQQNVPYPFHVTRSFQLDGVRRDIATLYLQSASGGLYRDDDLTLAVAARTGARAHVTTQAATMVHDTGPHPARQRVELDVADGAFLAFTPDPLVLFPGATLLNATRVTLAPGARAIVIDAFACHDPIGLSRPFQRLTQTLEITDHDGRRLVRERGVLDGADFVTDRSPLGPFKASGSMLICASGDVLPDPAALRQACDEAACVAGVTTLPNGVGLMLRGLAADGGDLRRGLETAFAQAFEALVGIAPTRRRK